VADSYAEGKHDEVLAICTDDPSYREIHVPVTVVKRSPQRLSAMPDKITLTALGAQAVPSRIVLVRDQEGQEVQIESVVADSPVVAAQWSQGPGAMSTLKISGDRARVAGDSLQTTIHVRVSQPEERTLDIPLTCTLK